MLYRILADVTVAVHLLFIVFVFFGGFLTFRWPRLAWVHVPSFLWGAAISLFDWVCPLTYLENDLRIKGETLGYATSFVEEYVVQFVYPEQFFGPLPRNAFIDIGFLIIVLNCVIYWRLSKRLRPDT